MDGALPATPNWMAGQGVHASSTTSLKVNLLTSFRAVVAIPGAEETVVRTRMVLPSSMLSASQAWSGVSTGAPCKEWVHEVVKQHMVSQPHERVRARAHTHGLCVMQSCMDTRSP
jgi:hypothetical protein